MKKGLLPLISSYLVHLLELFLLYKHPRALNDSWTYLEKSLEESSESLEFVSYSHELGDHSSSKASLALKVPASRSIDSALLPLILTPLCFRCIFCCLLKNFYICSLVRTFTSFSIVQKISVYLSLTLFLAFALRNSKCCT